MKPVLVAITFFILFTQFGFAQTLQSVTFFNGATDVNDIAVDNYGNFYATGFYYADLMQNGFTLLTSKGNSDTFIGKFTNSGAIIWLMSFGGKSFDVGRSITVDLEGNVYVVGDFSDSASIGGTQLIPSGGTDIFVLKFNSAGNLLWAKNFGGPLSEICNSMTTDASGNSYLGGDFYDSTSLGTHNFTSYGQYDIFILKLNTDGNILWAQQAGGERSENVSTITSDASGNIYLTGNFMMTASFGSKQLVSDFNGSVYFVKFNSSGECIWANQSSVPSSATGVGITVDPLGTVYASGTFFETLTLGSLSLFNEGGSDLFVTKLNDMGQFVWLGRASGTATFDYFFQSHIVVDAFGNSYVSGYFDGTVNFGSIQLNCPGVSEPYLAKLDPAGNFVWVQKGTGPYINSSNTVALLGNDQVFMGGVYGEHFSLGGPELPYWGCFIASYSAATGIQNDLSTPVDFSLSQNYPNPFNPSTRIDYSVPVSSNVVIALFDVLGNEISTLLNEHKLPGFYSLDFNSNSLPSGVYFYKLTAGNSSLTNKMILIK